MAQRKYSKELFQVRRISSKWWVVQIEQGQIKKVECAQTRSQANQYADDYTEKHYLDLYLQQQIAERKSAQA